MENRVISCDGQQESKQNDQMNKIPFTGIGTTRWGEKAGCAG